MTENKKFKRLVRARAARTGESYSTSLQHLRARKTEEAPMTDTENPEAPIPEEPTSGDSEIFSCSFCGKSQKDVKKLIAGPGSYICDECVALCADIISEDSDAELQPSEERVAAALLAMLKTSATGAQTAEAGLAKMVRQARRKGLDWTSIASSLGISADEAESRYGAG